MSRHDPRSMRCVVADRVHPGHPAACESAPRAAGLPSPSGARAAQPAYDPKSTPRATRSARCVRACHVEYYADQMPLTYVGRVPRRRRRAFWDETKFPRASFTTTPTRRPRARPKAQHPECELWNKGGTRAAAYLRAEHAVRTRGCTKVSDHWVAALINSTAPARRVTVCPRPSSPRASTSSRPATTT